MAFPKWGYVLYGCTYTHFDTHTHTNTHMHASPNSHCLVLSLFKIQTDTANMVCTHMDTCTSTLPALKHTNTHTHTNTNTHRCTDAHTHTHTNHTQTTQCECHCECCSLGPHQKVSSDKPGDEEVFWRRGRGEGSGISISVYNENGTNILVYLWGCME